MESVVRLTECDSEAGLEGDRVALLDVVVLKTCGQLVFDLFWLSGGNDDKTLMCDDSILWTDTDAKEIDEGSSSASSGIYTYLDAQMARAFDRLYDVMSRDLEKVNKRYQTPPKLELYNKLREFVHHYQLHHINRFVFGNGPCKDWGPTTTSALTTVRIWRLQFNDETKVAEGLLNTYKVASTNKEMHPFDVGMVAFAVFGFLVGYDTVTDYDILFMFRHIEDIFEPPTFERVHNSVLRNARRFFNDNGSKEDVAFFETLAENADIVAMFNWIFDLLAEQPEAVSKFICNPFPCDQSVECEIYDVSGKKMSPSYIIKLRIFYRWVLMEMFELLSGNRRDRMSLLDHHVKECLCCLSETSWLKLFEDVYAHALKHFTAILGEYDCPEHILQTFRDMWTNGQLKEIIMFCVRVMVEGNAYLKHRDSSTDSNESLGSE